MFFIYSFLQENMAAVGKQATCSSPGSPVGGANKTLEKKKAIAPLSCETVNLVIITSAARSHLLPHSLGYFNTMNNNL